MCFLVLSHVVLHAHAQPRPSVIRRLTVDGLYKHRPSWSPSGSLLAFARHEGNALSLIIRDVEACTERRLTTRTDSEYEAAWTSDGRSIVFTLVTTSPCQGDLDIYSMAVDGTDLKPLVRNAGALSHEEAPAVSPDGRWVALSSTRDGNQELYVISIEGGPLRRLTNDPALDARPSWSPDGRKLAFSTARFGDWEIATLDVEALAVTRLTESRGLDDQPAWSPDGKLLAFTSNRDGQFEVYTMTPEGQSLQLRSAHPARDHFPCWSPRGELTWVSDRDGGCDLYLGEVVADVARGVP